MLKATTLAQLLLFTVLHSLAQSTTFPFDSPWKYLDNGSNQGTDWRSPDFNDATWKTGTGWFGYGRPFPEIQTTIGYGTDPNNKFITTYFRKTFTIADYYLYQNFTFNVRRDDGVVVYLNGAEIYRDNMPAGAIGTATLSRFKGDNGLTPVSFTVDKKLLKAGANVLAAEVHQYKNNDNDLVFALSLTGDKKNTTDNISPTISSIKRLDPVNEVTNASVLKFRITFSEPVFGVDAKDFIFPGTNAAKGRIVSLLRVDSKGITYDATIHPVTGIGKLGIMLPTYETGITDRAGNPVNKVYDTLETYTVQQPSGLLLTRGPYLQAGNKTGVTIRWRTNLSTNSLIEVGTAPGIYTKSASDAANTNEHLVSIKGLKPGTKYFYQFGSSTQLLQSGVDNYFQTAPDTNAGKIKIAVFGDCGRKDNQANVLSAYLNYVKSNPAKLLLLLGDNAYQDGSDGDYQQGFFEPYESSILKNHILFPTPGNHDYNTILQSARDAPYFKNFTVPTKGECGGVPSKSISYYSFDWGNIHFISLDSYGTEGTSELRMYDTLGPQVTWLKKDLEANTKTWVIAYWHHPPFTMGSHNSDIEDELKLTRQNFIRIVERYGVDLVLCGHSHVYERSYLLNGYYGMEADFDLSKHAITSSSGRNDGTPNSEPFRTVAGMANKGTVYVVSGSSSKAGPVVKGKFPHNATPFALNSEGMFYLEVNQNRLDGKFINYDNTIGDQFTILKTAAIASKSARVIPANLAPELNVYPTMVNRGTQVSVFYDAAVTAEVVLIDMHGSSIATYRFKGTTKINTTGLAAGTYIIKMVDEKVTTYKRFVVME